MVAHGNGGHLIAVPPQNTSRTCPCCGHVSAANRQTQARFECVECGFEENADVVGAINVLRAGHARLACEVSAVGISGLQAGEDVKSRASLLRWQDGRRHNRPTPTLCGKRQNCYPRQRKCHRPAKRSSRIPHTSPPTVIQQVSFALFSAWMASRLFG
jgi:hypothetical protein